MSWYGKVRSMRSHNGVLVRLLLLVAGILLIKYILMETGGETIIVAKDENGDYDKIQDAIDNTTEGDTIRVWEGTYYENVVVNKMVNLVGNGSEETTIDGGGEDREPGVSSRGSGWWP